MKKLVRGEKFEGRTLAIRSPDYHPRHVAPLFAVLLAKWRSEVMTPSAGKNTTFLIEFYEHGSAVRRERKANFSDEEPTRAFIAASR